MPAYPSGFNTFVPSFDASGKLIVAYSRNPKDFALNQYVQIIPVKKSVGYFLKLTAEVAARVLSSTAADFVWTDANDAPSGAWNTESHNFIAFNTIRYAFPYLLGYKAVDQADWKILAVHGGFAAQQAMTARTLQVLNTLTTTGNWAASHVSATGTAIGGTNWGAGTAAAPTIKKSINAMVKQIMLDTVGVVRFKDLVLVVSPTTADLMGRSQEIHTYLQQSPFALAQIRGDEPSQNAAWGLPDQLYGVKVVVEDAVRVTSRKGATFASSFILGNQALMVSRPGGLMSEGSTSFSTAGLFMYEEMTVESRDDPDNRRTKARVVEDYAVNLLSDISGYLVSDVTT